MKTSLLRAALAVVVAAFALAVLAPAHGQSEKIKQKAKDVKRQVEGGQAKTNKPPPAPPAPPLPPAKKPAK